MIDLRSLKFVRGDFMLMNESDGSTIVTSSQR